MEDLKVKVVSPPSGKHGPYTFYKAFKIMQKGNYRVISLGQFFFMKLLDDMPLCIGELQFVWEEKNSPRPLASVRLYFLPEDTPSGRQPHHGQDEILALSEKMVLSLDDLASLIATNVKWKKGCKAHVTSDLKPDLEHGDLAVAFQMNSFGVDVEDVKNPDDDENAQEDTSPEVTIMSYTKYCRYRAVMKRLENCEDEWLRDAIVCAFGGHSAAKGNNRVYFCRDVFDSQDLEELEIRCDHLAPVFKGRRRKRTDTKHDTSAESSYDSSSSAGTVKSESMKVMDASLVKLGKRDTPLRNGFRLDKYKVSQDEQAFLIDLHKYMKSRGSPIGRIPSLGFKQVDMYYFYTMVEKIGGYEQVSNKRMWKYLYDQLGGNPGSTSAATCTRRHYEKLLLPYERHKRGKDIKPIVRKKTHTSSTTVGLPVKRVEETKQNAPFQYTEPQKPTPQVKEEQKVKVEPEVAVEKVKVDESVVADDNKVVVKDEMLASSHQQKAMIIKEEIEKMKQRKDAQRQSDHERMWDDRRKIKWGEKVRKPSGGQKTVRELLHENGKADDLNNSDTGDSKEDIVDIKNIKEEKPSVKYSEKSSSRKFDLDGRHRSHDLSHDVKPAHFAMETTRTHTDTLQQQQQQQLHSLFSPLGVPRQFLYPQMFPMGSPLQGVAPMALPFMLPQFPMPAMHPLMSPLSKDNKSLDALNRLVIEQRNKSSAMDRNTANQSRSRTISPQRQPPPSNHLQAPKGPLTSNPSESPLTITPAHTHTQKRQYPFMEADRKVSSFPVSPSSSQREGSLTSSNHGDSKRRQIQSTDSNSRKSSLDQPEAPVLDLSMKTLRAQEARHRRGESLLFNTSFNKENKGDKNKDSFEAPQDLSVKHAGNSSPSDMPKHKSSSSASHAGVTLNIPSHRTNTEHSSRSADKSSPTTSFTPKSADAKVEKSDAPSSAALKIPQHSTIGGLPVDFSTFVHPAFGAQMMLQPSVFPTPLQLQQMIQTQVAAGLPMPMIRSEFPMTQSLFPTSFPAVPSSVAKTSTTAAQSRR